MYSNKELPANEVRHLVCPYCKLIIYIPGVGKKIAYYSFNNEILICPICSSLNKEPTKKMTDEELEQKKIEIKNKLI